MQLYLHGTGGDIIKGKGETHTNSNGFCLSPTIVGLTKKQMLTAQLHSHHSSGYMLLSGEWRSIRAIFSLLVLLHRVVGM